MSLEKELNKSSNTDVNIIVISYLCMFIYASIALGGVVPGMGLYSFVRTKFSLGLFGIAVVLMSVSASVGMFAYFGLKATLIIAEVIPFLVLAIGVDNIFLLTHELQNINGQFSNDPIEERVSRAVGYIGPSILLSCSTEVNAFLLAASVSMPAVRNFALYSAGAVFINTLLQLTLFVSALALDQKRTESNRVDCFPFLKVNPDKDLTESLFSRPATIALASPAVFEEVKEPAFSKWIRRHYAPILLKPSVKRIVLAVFACWVAISIMLLGKMELGLDQRFAVPSDSYLVKYFDDVYDHLSTGPPVYFIVTDSNTTNAAEQHALCGRFAPCDEFSLVSIIEQERKRSELSYVIDPVASWIDDFLMWMNPTLDECCRVKKNTEFDFCSPNASPRQCDVCFANKTYDMEDPPQGREFLEYFKNWISSPSDPCPLGGRAPYSDSVVVDYETLNVNTSAFRSSHTPLRSQSDFINAYASARRIANYISEKTGANVYPYSLFYIFFAQYPTIVRQTVSLGFSALLSSAEISVVFLGSFQTAIVLFFSITMIFINVCGLMALWGVSLNAVSLVNLIICIGIGIEFCAHIVRGFTFASAGMLASRNARALNALVDVGGSVLGGIALTKFIGVFVLAFTRSKIFEIYYFKMWLALVIVATLHSLVFLPVALSVAGGKGYVLDKDDVGLAADLASRQEGEDEI